MTIEIIRGDITQLDVDVIVNAANTTLSGGGGVDGAIHRRAGPKLLEACRSLGGCPTGSAKLTDGFLLPARFVIHAVGPIYRDGQHGEAEALASAYQASCSLVRSHGLRSVAFSAISTGIYGYPIAEASAIAVKTVCSSLCDRDVRIVFSVFGQEVEAAITEALDAWRKR